MSTKQRLNYTVVRVEPAGTDQVVVTLRSPEGKDLVTGALPAEYEGMRIKVGHRLDLIVDTASGLAGLVLNDRLHSWFFLADPDLHSGADPELD